MIMRNLLITIVVLAPALVLFGMIIFSGKQEDTNPKE